jgi:hypothetical protein
MAILELSAARELSVDMPIDRRIAAPKKNSAVLRILFIHYLQKVVCGQHVSRLLYAIKSQGE